MQTTSWHATPNCTGHWIDVSTLSASAWVCSECRARLTHDPELLTEGVKRLDVPPRPRIPWLLLLIAACVGAAIGLLMWLPLLP